MQPVCPELRESMVCSGACRGGALDCRVAGREELAASDSNQDLFVGQNKPTCRQTHRHGVANQDDGLEEMFATGSAFELMGGC